MKSSFIFEADAGRLGYVGKRPGSRDSDSWFTPPKYIEAARTVLGGIDLDPFSSDVANLTIKARHYYTETNDAFFKSWFAGTVFMNPPYGPFCRKAVEKFVDEFKRGRFKKGIVLVNNATETVFFQLLLNTAHAVCFTNHRISFYNSDGKKISGNTRGQCFFYVARKPNVALFRRTFTQFGKVIACK